MSNSGSNPECETRSDSRRASGARPGLSVKLESGERDAIQKNPKATSENATKNPLNKSRGVWPR